MQNTQINPSIPAAGSMDAGMTEGTMGRLGNFTKQIDNYTTGLKPPKVTKTDITADIK